MSGLVTAVKTILAQRAAPQPIDLIAVTNVLTWGGPPVPLYRFLENEMLAAAWLEWQVRPWPEPQGGEVLREPDV